MVWTTCLATIKKDYIFGHLADEHAANTTSNPNGTVFAMYSDNRIWDNQDDVKSILHRDLPDYVLDAWGGDIRRADHSGAQSAAARRNGWLSERQGKNRNRRRCGRTSEAAQPCS